MGRAKLRMELIPKEKTRNTTYHKRKHGIIKKANEFTILCDVDTVMIIYPPNSDEPEIWPESPEKIKKTIGSYKAKKGDSGKRTYDLHDFYEDRKKKIEDELVKARKKNIEAKYATWFDDFNGLTEAQLRQFAMQLENKENVVRAHLEFKKRNMNVQPFMFDLENKIGQYQDRGGLQGLQGLQGLHPGPDNSSLIMNNGALNHDSARALSWFSDPPMGGLCVPLKREPNGFGYPGVVDGGVVYDGSSQWGLQAPVVPDFVRQEHEELVNNNGVGEFVGDHHIGRFNGNI